MEIDWGRWGTGNGKLYNKTREGEFISEQTNGEKEFSELKLLRY